jgi:HSP20 family protein
MTILNFKPVRHRNPRYNFWQLPTTSTNLAQPVVNILETKAGFRIELAAPGMQKDAFKLHIENDTLTISATTATEQHANDLTFHRHEFTPTAFERVFQLPERIDPNKVNATYANGILVVELVHKAEKKPVAKKIAVQ